MAGVERNSNMAHLPFERWCVSQQDSKTHGIQALAMGSLPGACSLGWGPSHSSASPAFGSARALWRDHEEDTRSMLLGCQRLC